MRTTKAHRRRPLPLLLAASLFAFALAACDARATDAPAAQPVNTATGVTDAAAVAAQPTTAATTPTPATADGANATAVDAGEKGSTPAAASAEWPQWRGPNRDGLALGVNAPAAWPKELKRNWRVTVGVGHSSPVVSGGMIYQFARQGEDEVLLALDASTGKELWRAGAIPAPYTVNPAASGHGK
ncbi:MAG TPA: hypothetical protein VF591_23265, partial [Pyrinomonadaceae bacterium]